MSEIDHVTQNYIAAIKTTKTYRRYCAQKDKVKALPELWAQINDYRKRKFELQSLASGEELYDRIDAFEREYAQLKDNPDVREFLDAELAFCRMMQESSLHIVEELDFE